MPRKKCLPIGNSTEMDSKRPTKGAPAKAGANGRADVAAWVKRGGLEPYSESVQAAAKRLVKLLPWPAALGLYEFQQAIYAYDKMESRGEWDRKSQRLQDEWKARFEAVANEFLELIETAPCPPGQFGFPIRDVLLMHAIKHALGKELPAEQSTEWWREMLDYEAGFDRSGLNLSHAIKHFMQRQRADWGSSQPLAKPNDAHSNRVLFAINLWRYTDLDDGTIAAIASQMMIDASVDPADVRRWTIGYAQRRQKRISGKSKESSFTGD